MKIFLFYVALFSTSILCVAGLDDPKWMVETKRQKYSDYELCLKKREDDFKTFQNSERYHAVFALQGSNVALKCFDCLDPADEEVLEDIWKPNGSFIRRKVTEFREKIRDVVRSLKLQGKNDNRIKIDERLQAHCWEFSPPQNDTWIKVVNMSQPKESYERASKMIKSFMDGEKNRYSIGDLFELKISSADESDTGWYRCFQCANHDVISRAYFLEIFPQHEIEMREYSQTAALQSEFAKEIKDKDIQVYGKVTPWSKCNKCGDNVIGESKRRISCYVKPLESSSRSKFGNSEFPALQQFGELPCQSSLIPASIRNQIQNYPVYEEYQQCKAKCLPSKNETRVVEGADERGMLFEFDRLLPGEFALTERLPPLKSHVHRKVISKVEKKRLILDCGLRNDDGILWRRKLIKENKIKQLIDISSSSLIKENPDGRIVINADGQLIFKQVKIDDSGLYSCSTQARGLIATFKVFIKVDPTSAAKVIGWVQVAIRLIFFSCLVILVLTVMLRAKKTAKKAADNNNKV